MQADDLGLSKMMRRILEKRDEMLARIDENGVLTLVMDDIRKGVSFDEAGINDIRGSVIPIHRARRVILSHKGKVRFLKDRVPDPWWLKPKTIRTAKEQACLEQDEQRTSSKRPDSNS